MIVEIRVGFETGGEGFSYVDHVLGREQYHALVSAWQAGEGFHTVTLESRGETIIKLASVIAVGIRWHDDADAKFKIRYQVEETRHDAAIVQAVEEQTADLQIQHRVEHSKRDQEIEQAINDQISTVGFRR